MKDGHVEWYDVFNNLHVYIRKDGVYAMYVPIRNMFLKLLL